MKLRAAAKRLREVAGAVLVGADGITPVKTDRADEAARPHDVEEAGL